MAPFLLFILLSIIVSSSSSSPLTSVVAPISKDPSTSLYTLSLNNNNNNNQHYLLDLNGPLLWSTCPRHHPTIPCSSTTCAMATTDLDPRCRHLTNPNATLATCACTTHPTNPITKYCSTSDLTLSNITLDHLSSPITLVSSCATRTLLASLPVGSAGVIGLARSALAMPDQLSLALSLKPQLAICLPSTTSSPGVAFFGNKPYRFMPPTPFDASTILSYSPLVTNPRNPNDYLIKLHGIAINDQAVRILDQTIGFDTAAPYTTLRTPIYLPFLRAFTRAMQGVARAPRVKPFDLCLDSTGLGVTRVGYNVPRVDLMLPGGKNWTVFGANSMKQVSEGVACLAFVDGGARAEQAVVVGGFQMEDNLLVFDEERSLLGFSSSLLFFRTTCGNFDFTAP